MLHPVLRQWISLKLANGAFNGFPCHEKTFCSLSGRALVPALSEMCLTGAFGPAYLYDAVTDGAVRLPANQQQADDHHHGDGHGHHQQPHHGASVEGLQGVGLLWTEET